MMKDFLNYRELKALVLILGFTAMIGMISSGWTEEKTSTCGDWTLINSEMKEKTTIVNLLETKEIDSSEEVNVRFPGFCKSSVQAKDGNTYDMLRVPGCGSSAEKIGAPQLPFKGFYMQIPHGVDVSVKIIKKKEKRLGKGYHVFPKQPPQPDSLDIKDPKFHFDQISYSMDRFFPDSPVILDDPQIMRGRRIVFVKIFPLRFNPVSTEMIALEDIKLELEYKGKKDIYSIDKMNRLANRDTERFDQSVILNYKPMEKEKTLLSSSSCEKVGYLVIVADAFYEEVQPLVEWKHKKGYTTKVVMMSDIDDPGQDGVDEDDIKAKIQYEYDYGDPAPYYVLLVGDREDLPSFAKSALNGEPWWMGYWQEWYSDIPYSLLDNEGGGQDDYTPDVILGRIPVHLESKCTDVVNKILKYDKTPDMANWYKGFLAAAFFQDTNADFPTADGISVRWFMESTMTIYKFLTMDQDGPSLTGNTAIFPEDQSFSQYHFRPYDTSNPLPHRCDLNRVRWNLSPSECYPDPVPTWVVNSWTSEEDATEDISTAINNGVGLVIHRDHGAHGNDSVHEIAESYWCHPKFGKYWDEGSAQVIDDIASLNNGDKTPVVFSINCKTGAFWKSSSTYDPDCLCENFLEKSSGGCVGISGAARISWSGINDLMIYGITDCFWPAFDPTYPNPPSIPESKYPFSSRPAVALNYGKYYMKQYLGEDQYTRYCILMFHWFGDPEMMLRSDFPNHLYVKAYLEDQRISAVNFGDWQPNQGALVCVSHPNAANGYWRGFPDSDGFVQISTDDIEFCNSSADYYDLVVTAPNRNPFVEKIYMNDMCCKAVTLSNGLDTEFSDHMRHAGLSPEPFPIEVTPDNPYKDIWYKITPGTNKHVEVSIDANVQKTGFVVYFGNGGSLMKLGTSQGNGYNESLEFYTDSQTTDEYYIRVYNGTNYTSDDETITACWDNQQRPVYSSNDECVDAQNLTNGNIRYFDSEMSSATPSSQSYPACVTNTPLRDIWYKIRPGTNKLVSIETNASDAVTGFVLYSGSCGSLQELNEACSNDEGGCSMGDGCHETLEIITDDVEKDYYIRVYSNSVNSPRGFITISWIELEEPIQYFPLNHTSNHVYNYGRSGSYSDGFYMQGVRRVVGPNGGTDYSLSFNGINGRVEGVNTRYYDHDIGSVVMWVKDVVENSENYNQSVAFAVENGWGLEYLRLRVEDDRSVAYYKYDYNSDQIAGYTSLDDGDWHQVACTWNNGKKNIKLYIDGELEDIGFYNVLQHSYPQDYRIGDLLSTYFYRGTMDELRVYDRELAPLEIKALKPPTTPLPPPDNDECIDAEIITSGETKTGALTASATPSTENTCNPGVPDVWYEFTVPSEYDKPYVIVNYSDWGDASFEGFASIYSGSCGEILEECDTTRNSSSPHEFHLEYISPTPGETIYICVGSELETISQQLQLTCFDKMEEK